MSKKVKFSKPSGPFYKPYTGKISSKVDPIYDDVDIFEGGPAGQVLVDIDPLYGGIQLQEDELPGSQAMRDLARASKEITDVLTPSEETKAEIAERDKKEQEAFAMLLKATGVEPESFEAGLLEGKLRRDNELRKLLNLPYGFDKALTDFRLGFGTAGQFLFGEANKGLTTMTEEGTKFKDLPFDQKLGIAILPIDLLDAVGITYGGAQVLKTLIKGGVKQFGKKSGKNVKDLLTDEEFLSKIETEQPGFLKQLKELGIPIEARFASGPPKKTRTPRSMDRDPLGLLDDSEFGMGKGQSAFNKNLPSQLEVDEKLKRANLEAQALKKETDKLKKVKGLEGTFEGRAPTDPAPVIKKKTLEEFSKAYDYAMTKGKMTSSYLRNMRNKYENFDDLLEQSVKKGFTKKET